MQSQRARTLYELEREDSAVLMAVGYDDVGYDLIPHRGCLPLAER